MSNTEDTNYRGQVLRVAIPTPLRRIFDYLPPNNNTVAAQQFKPGMRVLVPFGHRKVVGILIELHDKSALSKSKLKPAYALLDAEPVFTPAIFRTLLWGASYYQHPIGEVFATALPSRLRTGRPLREESQVWRIASPSSDLKKESLDRAFKQKALFEFIEAAVEITSSQCLGAGFSKQLLAQLQKKNLVEQISIESLPAAPFKAPVKTNNPNFKLNAEQDKAVVAISRALQSFSCFLLDGVTGSGKTEVYMRVMQKQLSAGKQCLVLVPEIGLTPQTISRFEKRFACRIVSLHSGLSDRERLAAWLQARDGSAGIVIGTRSAVFTPMANPGLIVVDEEHDLSFKQQDGFRYSARDLAVMRAREENVCVILGSATPSLESIYNARRNKFERLLLDKRAGSASPSSMQVTDISEGSIESGFSEQLLYKMQQHLNEKHQILVFINRRGYAPILNCSSCGWIAECEDCVAQLTVHVDPPSMRCHHCGSVKQLPRFCPHCKSKDLTTIGIGTQKIESFLSKHFATTNILRIDRDSTRSKRNLANMLQQVRRGDPCILLGTQMLAKGHHFPNITLVAIVDADAGLFSADFRGQEHMAQTIIQVAGRAGRAECAGEVVIQSRHSTHPTLQMLARGSYSEFAAMLLAERQRAGMPPYSHLCLIRAEAPDSRMPLSYLKQVYGIAQELCRQHYPSVELLGPLPAPMEKRAGRYRSHLLLKSGRRTELQNLLTHLTRSMEAVKTSRKLRWSIDIDPLELI